MTPSSSDIKIPLETPIRAPSAVPVDDAVLPFEVASILLIVAMIGAVVMSKKKV